MRHNTYAPAVFNCFYLFISLLYADSVDAQSVANDSRGKDVFNFYKSQSLSIPASSATGTFKISYTQVIGNGTQYFLGQKGDKITPTFHGDTVSYTLADSAFFTVAKSYGITGSVAIGNLKTNLAQFASFHPSYTWTIGFGRNIDAFNDYKNIAKLNFFSPSSWTISAYGNLDNVVLYDATVKDTNNWQHPFTWGFIGEYSFFPFKWLAISLSANYERGNNLATLAAYQSNHPTFSDNNVIALGDIAGKLGAEKKLDNYRFRVSFPIFFPAITFKRRSPLQLCLVPYYNSYGTAATHFSRVAGLFASILGDQFYGKANGTIVSGAGIGLDFIRQDGWSKGNVFVSGTLDLYKILAAKKQAVQAAI